MNEMELQTTLDPIEMDMGDPEIVYSPVLPNPEGEPTDDLTKVQIQGNIYQIKDPEVHDWAREEEKPTYTKAEVGLGNVDNTSDLDKPISTATQNALDGKVDNSELGNYYTKSEVNSALDNKADKSDTYTKTETDNLLSEKADSSSVYTKTETDTALGNKVDKVSGKGLSTNDYDDTAKGIVNGVTSALDGKVDKDGDKVLSDNNYSDTDKTKLDGIEDNATHTEVDTEISATSTNPLQNKAIYDLLNDLLPEAEETGNPISISNASGFNAKALTVDMLPIQDLHGYDKPWAGGSGKNKFDINKIWTGYDIGSTERCKYYHIDLPQGTYTVSTNVIDNTNPNVASVLVTNFEPVTSPSSSEYGVFNNRPRTITATEGLWVFIRTQSSAGYLTWNENTFAPYYIQVESGSTATSYEPYSNICPISGRTSLDVTVNGETETINFGETVYGGTCDVVNGGTSNIMAIVDLNNLNWSFITGNRWNTTDLQGIIKGVDYSAVPNLIAEQYKAYSNNQIYSDTSLIGICVSSQGSVTVRNGSTTEKPKGKIAYELATPTTLTTPATPISLNKGNNTLSTSGDNMDLKYSTIISNPTSLTMARPSLGMIIPTIDSTEDTRLLDNANVEVVEEPTEE